MISATRMTEDPALLFLHRGAERLAVAHFVYSLGCPAHLGRLHKAREAGYRFVRFRALATGALGSVDCRSWFLFLLCTPILGTAPSSSPVASFVAILGRNHAGLRRQKRGPRSCDTVVLCPLGFHLKGSGPSRLRRDCRGVYGWTSTFLGHVHGSKCEGCLRVGPLSLHASSPFLH